MFDGLLLGRWRLLRQVVAIPNLGLQAITHTHVYRNLPLLHRPIQKKCVDKLDEKIRAHYKISPFEPEILSTDNVNNIKIYMGECWLKIDGSEIYVLKVLNSVHLC